MTYLSVYEAVYDQCDVERNWEGHAHIGDQKLLNVAEEGGFGRHGDSKETGL